YHGFFAELAKGFNQSWRSHYDLILENSPYTQQITDNWRKSYHKCLNQIPVEQMDQISNRLKSHNPPTPLLSPLIESVWQSIALENHWQPFADLVSKLQHKI
ncbi:MAG: protein adenylyltransferase SelO family protein, partial [Cyanobacteria bacterium P01_A01_bin.83]